MTEKILIIEDTRSFSRVLKSLIEQAHGFVVDVVEDYASARALLEGAGQDYFVAIVDLHLPDAVDGKAVELVSRAGIPAIVFTAVSDRAMEEDLWSRGIADYAHKSGAFSLEYVVWAVNRIYLNRNLAVMVVDDSRVARRNMERLLKRQNYQIHSVASGEEALDCIERNPDIAIAVVDCFMEGMGGLALTGALREVKSSSELEIIGVSAQGGQNLPAQFIKAGANDYLVKPFVPEELLCRINRSADRIESYITQKKLNEDKNKLLGTAAHDIRGPLAAINTASKMILHQHVDNRRVNAMAEMINKNSMGLIELLESLLDVSAIESGRTELHLSKVDLSNTLQERVELYTEQAENKQIKLNLRLDIPEGMITFLDDIKIKQVVDNLISNAIKYSYSAASIDICLSRDGDLLLLSVRDFGAGIPESEAEKLFKPFSVLSSKSTAGEKQTGLGLAITKNIIEAHKGKIYYKPATGGGSYFFVELPVG